VLVPGTGFAAIELTAIAGADATRILSMTWTVSTPGDVEVDNDTVITSLSPLVDDALAVAIPAMSRLGLAVLCLLVFGYAARASLAR
jgi:hypothetical protein